MITNVRRRLIIAIINGYRCIAHRMTATLTVIGTATSLGHLAGPCWMGLVEMLLLSKQCLTRGWRLLAEVVCRRVVVELWWRFGNLLIVDGRSLSWRVSSSDLRRGLLRGWFVKLKWHFHHRARDLTEHISCRCNSIWASLSCIIVLWLLNVLSAVSNCALSLTNSLLIRYILWSDNP